MIHHDIPPLEFLRYVHDIDLSFMEKDRVLRSEIEKLNLKKMGEVNSLLLISDQLKAKQVFQKKI